MRKENGSPLQKAVTEGIDHALTIVHTSFEKNPTLSRHEDELTYHTTRHTREVIDRTARILGAIYDEHPTKVSSQDIYIGKLAAAFHDTVQDWKPEETVTIEGLPIRKRKRASGLIEAKSVDLAHDFMNKKNQGAAKEIFNRNHFDTAHEAIMLTVPTFDTTLRTVIQDGFEESRIVPQAVALADLGGAPMDGGIKHEALALFDEENLDYKAYANGIETGSRKRDKKEEGFYHDRLMTWIASQKDFLKGREEHLAVELDSMGSDVKRSISKLFTKFQQSFDEINKLIQDFGTLKDFPDWNRLLKQELSK